MAERVGEKDVEPAADIQTWHLYAIVLAGDRDRVQHVEVQGPGYALEEPRQGRLSTEGCELSQRQRCVARWTKLVDFPAKLEDGCAQCAQVRAMASYQLVEAHR